MLAITKFQLAEVGGLELSVQSMWLSNSCNVLEYLQYFFPNRTRSGLVHFGCMQIVHVLLGINLV